MIRARGVGPDTRLCFQTEVAELEPTDWLIKWGFIMPLWAIWLVLVDGQKPMAALLFIREVSMEVVTTWNKISAD